MVWTNCETLDSHLNQYMIGCHITKSLVKRESNPFLEKSLEPKKFFWGCGCGNIFSFRRPESNISLLLALPIKKARGVKLKDITQSRPAGVTITCPISIAPTIELVERREVEASPCFKVPLTYRNIHLTPKLVRWSWVVHKFYHMINRECQVPTRRGN